MFTDVMDWSRKTCKLLDVIVPKKYSEFSRTSSFTTSTSTICNELPGSNVICWLVCATKSSEARTERTVHEYYGLRTISVRYIFHSMRCYIISCAMQAKHNQKICSCSCSYTQFVILDTIQDPIASINQPVAVPFAVLNQTLTGIVLDPFFTKVNLARPPLSPTVSHSEVSNPMTTPGRETHNIHNPY